MASKRNGRMSSSDQLHSSAGKSRMVYLDHNATTPLDPRVLEAMLPFLTHAFGNPASRSHAFGHEADRAVEKARTQVASLLHAAEKEIVWTSGATEANNLAIKGVAYALRGRGRHIVTQATEHYSVLDPCRWLAAEGFDVTVLPVDSLGSVHPDQVRQSIRPDTVLVSVMWANNEIGTVQPIPEIVAVCRERGVLFHSDATQAVGKLPIDLKSVPVDLLTLSAHKFYGPKGSGALYVSSRTPRIKLIPLLHGGGHERGMRSGTINVPGVVGLGAACDVCERELVAESARLNALRNELERGIISKVRGVQINGDIAHRLPQTSHLSFEDLESEAMLVAMDDIALSTGSACTSANVEPSHVLSAMGLSESAIYGSLRFGLGRVTTIEEVRNVISRVVETVARLRGLRQLA